MPVRRMLLPCTVWAGQRCSAVYGEEVIVAAAAAAAAVYRVSNRLFRGMPDRDRAHVVRLQCDARQKRSREAENCAS